MKVLSAWAAMVILVLDVSRGVIYWALDVSVPALCKWVAAYARNAAFRLLELQRRELPLSALASTKR